MRMRCAPSGVLPARLADQISDLARSEEIAPFVIASLIGLCGLTLPEVASDIRRRPVSPIGRANQALCGTTRCCRRVLEPNDSLLRRREALTAHALPGALGTWQGPGWDQRDSPFHRG